MSYYEQAILEYIQSEFLVEPVALTVSTPLIEQGIVDSLGLFRLVSFIEEKFGVQFEPTDVAPQNFHTIQAIAAFVQHKSGA